MRLVAIFPAESAGCGKLWQPNTPKQEVREPFIQRGEAFPSAAVYPDGQIGRAVNDHIQLDQ
jgi:hypothetical protein